MTYRVTYRVVIIFKHEFPPYPFILRQTTWISDVCVIFAQLSSLGDSDPHETLQARREKGECSLS